MLKPKSSYKLPKLPGIYQFLDENNKVIYVGKAKNLRLRVGSYFNFKVLGTKTRQMVKTACGLKWIVVASEIDALLLEAKLIKDLKPKFNVILKDDKSYIYIKITNGSIPQITTARREKSSKGIQLFGPFPSARTVRDVLVTIRHIFPYCTHKRPPKSCLYVHLGLCPNPYKSEEARVKYKKDIRKIIMLLSGKKASLVKQMIRDMEKYSKMQNYEEAGKFKKQIEELNYISQPIIHPEKYVESPDLVEDIKMKKLEDAKSDLNLITLPKRIECYDISNIGGSLATGSMVVFADGEPDKGQYRRFRIKFVDSQDDTGMIKEVLSRRFKNDWPHPDLIVIDGGRGQLNAALSIVRQKKLKIPVVTLAKRLEEIHIEGQILPLKLPKDKTTLRLLQYLRDEAHRFAVSYHRKLRAKKMVS